MVGEARTGAAHLYEIAFHDRGSVDPTRMRMAGSWSVCWYNGLIVSSEIARGLDTFELMPSGDQSRNELVGRDYLNVQGQPRFTWPASFVVARAYLDQLERSKGLDGGPVPPSCRTAATLSVLK